MVGAEDIFLDSQTSPMHRNLPYMLYKHKGRRRRKNSAINKSYLEKNVSMVKVSFRIWRIWFIWTTSLNHEKYL